MERRPRLVGVGREGRKTKRSTPKKNRKAETWRQRVTDRETHTQRKQRETEASKDREERGGREPKKKRWRRNRDRGRQKGQHRKRGRDRGRNGSGREDKRCEKPGMTWEQLWGPVSSPRVGGGGRPTHPGVREGLERF